VSHDLPIIRHSLSPVAGRHPRLQCQGAH
jgi:hypothetical protein